MASKALLIAAQSIMDSYYQDFAPDDSFFQLEDFADWLGKAYGKIADDVAKQIYQGSRDETGTGQITFSQDWWAKKNAKIGKDGLLEIDFKIAGFTYDEQNSGIQEVKGAGKYIRTTLTELWVLDGNGKSNIIYWWPEFDKIKFQSSGCNVEGKSVDVYYIPSADDEQFKLPKSKEFEIATTAWNFMMSAKKETPYVDMTNDSNQNVTPQTETDTKEIKPVGM